MQILVAIVIWTVFANLTIDAYEAFIGPIDNVSFGVGMIFAAGFLWFNSFLRGA